MSISNLINLIGKFIFAFLAGLLVPIGLGVIANGFFRLFMIGWNF
jgi:hypothetical protein